ncbi:Polysaccharide deacetylase [Vibrio xiamenensis]|uniref:Polysaccharide deacetylase n=1 Tax=Vibrio xiamenensis TaxID=861298 RepID=A0A1G8GJ32_9VIBR|nr:polysaccharide deacetylase family protein [Vibrio xiamenensis]SDH94405.1 Polysaccharide deacetylase [Vibrio xiamenensis]
MKSTSGLYGRLLILGLLSSLALPTKAAGPAKIATIDRSTWPKAINSSSAFDQASAAEIRRFASVIANQSLDNIEQIQTLTGITKVDTHSVHRWIAKTKIHLLENYRKACPQCQVQGWQDLVRDSQTFEQTSKFSDWRLASLAFYQRYFYEQVRLAALFPRISSEIERFDSQSEQDGFDFSDKQFLLTYDDGPSTDKVVAHQTHNLTRDLITKLNDNNIHALFFVLGESLDHSSVKLDEYSQQCIGSHGQQHKSHQNWQFWQQSLDQMRSKLASQNMRWFRPPYGQRTPELIANLKQHNERVMLWNIDSQDWNKKLSNQQVHDRVTTLMLLWRKGIILYHDIHPRAVDNLPLFIELRNTHQIELLDCHSL